MNGVRIFRLPVRRYRGTSTARYLLSYLTFFVAALATVSWLAARHHYHAVHVHSMPDALVFTALVPRLLGARVVLDLHDTMPELYRSKFHAGPTHPLIRLIALQERASIAFASRVVCVHQPHRRLLIDRGVAPEKLSVVLNVSDPTVFGPMAAPRRGCDGMIRFVYHGTVAERQGLDIALAAFRAVQAELPDVRLAIYGDGDAAERLEREIAASGLGRVVDFRRGFVPVDQVPGLLRDADVGVVPYRLDPATDYMVPVKVFEYVHLGMPVAASRLRALRYYFGDDAIAYFTPGAADELASQLRLLALDAPRRMRLAQAAQEALRQLGWDQMKEALFQAFDRG